MIDMIDLDTGKVLGEINDEEMKFLVSQLEEESESDTDYYFDQDTLLYLQGKGLAPHLEQILTAAMQGKEGVEIQFKQK